MYCETDQSQVERAATTPNAYILLIGDDNAYLESLRAYLTVKGFAADVALDGETALSLAK